MIVAIAVIPVTTVVTHVMIAAILVMIVVIHVTIVVILVMIVEIAVIAVTNVEIVAILAVIVLQSVVKQIHVIGKLFLMVSHLKKRKDTLEVNVGRMVVFTQ
jgi:hypothetical protein